MRKLLTLFVMVLIAGLAFSQISDSKVPDGKTKCRCEKFVDANQDGICDNFRDANNDGRCDACKCNKHCKNATMHPKSDVAGKKTPAACPNKCKSPCGNDDQK